MKQGKKRGTCNISKQTAFGVESVPLVAHKLSGIAELTMAA